MGIRNLRRAATVMALGSIIAAGWAVAQPAKPPQSTEDAIARLLRETDAAKAAGAAGRAPVPIIMSARIGEHQDRTRFVLELSDPIDLRTFTIALPNRVVIDMPQVQWRLDGPPRPSGHGAIRSYRYGQFRPGNSRIVIDLAKPVRLSEPQVLPPQGGNGYRLVVDLFPTTQAKFNASAGWPTDLQAREAAAQMASLPKAPVQNVPAAARKKVIVVDAGHGGIDSGTNGVNGLVEKDLVLATALKLKTALQSRGFIVYLTRETDVYIPLTQRVAISRNYKADLFISLHADSHPQPSTSGLSVYTLSQQGSDKEAAALARKENQSDVIAGVDLAGENSAVAPILLDLAQRDTMNKSSRFAETLVASASKVTDILPRQPHRSAAFVVLKAPDVPAVLVELGYLSNSSDARQMKTNDWRVRVADAIALAVVRHFSPSGGSGPAARNGSE